MLLGGYFCGGVMRMTEVTNPSLLTTFFEDTAHLTI